MYNLLVTGGCGFIGTNFIRYLLEDTDFSGRIINVDKLTYAGNAENLEGVKDRFFSRYVFEQADICDHEAVDRIFEKYDVDSVCHFAAESHVDRSIAAPGDFVFTNVVGTFHLLEAARNRKDRIIRFHHISTDEVYGSLGDDGVFTETTPYAPNSPYSASKAGADHLVRAYGKTYGLDVTLSNCSNNYGPYQFPEKLIPLMVLNGKVGKSLPVYGDGKNIRDWLYVKDHCEAVWAIMSKGRSGQTYNVGGKNEKRNIDMVRFICRYLDEKIGMLAGGPREKLIEFVTDRPGHDFRYAIDFSKLQNELSWEPAHDLEAGVKQTVDWYLANTPWVDRVVSGEYRQWCQAHYGK